MAGLTPFQTVGPYLHLGLRAGCEPMRGASASPAIVVTGRLVDGVGAGIPDGALEFWAPGFHDIGRVWTDADGMYRLATTKPCAYAGDGGEVHAPHFAVRVLARGILTQYLTRIYFSDEPENARDVVLARVPADRRATLIAAAHAPGAYRFDIVVQGAGETVFFDV